MTRLVKNSPPSALPLTTHILVPAPGVDLRRWAVIACDQFTSQPSYWKEVENVVGDEPSTLGLILPEYRLGGPDRDREIQAIKARMQDYLARGLLRDLGEGYMLVERRQSDGSTRTGLIAAVDLEAYDYRPDSRAPIRPSEATLVERLPPRVAIRRGAAIELPHVLLLLNDPGRTTLEPTPAELASLRPTYETDLMLGGGSVRGWFLEGPRAERLTGRLEAYAADGQQSLCMAVGDGNHSLAAAKAVWEDLKASGTLPAPDHPARYALVEIVNLYDPGIRFEPIHRLLTDVDAGRFVDFLRGRDDVDFQARGASNEAGVRLVSRGQRDRFYLRKGNGMAPSGLIDDLIEGFCLSCRANARPGIDYIHGEQSLVELAARPDTLGLLLPAMDKEEFFPHVRAHGPLPRKAFSIGEALDKRFYLECRRIQD